MAGRQGGTDDGVGMHDMSSSGGLGTMRQRAEELGGSFAIEPVRAGGTTPTWRVPV
jgi:signal transduction histidine kinase